MYIFVPHYINLVFAFFTLSVSRLHNISLEDAGCDVAIALSLTPPFVEIILDSGIIRIRIRILGLIGPKPLGIVVQ